MEWLQHTTLRVASLLAPGDQRAEWMEEWRSELWYVPSCEATRFCLGAFRDAFWLRRNNASSWKWTGIHLESPVCCLALLAILSAMSISIAVHLPAAAPTGDLLDAGMGLLLLSCLFLSSTLVIWRTPANRHPMPWAGRLRLGAFLVLKILLLEPLILAGFMVQIALGRFGGLIGLGFNAAFILALRWAIVDQRRRCPVCLRLLSNPVVIGTSSRTFLEWYGIELICSRGHGLLQTSEISSSYSGRWWLGASR
jgi:hypothetical protein